MPLDPEVAALLEEQKSLPPRSALSIGETREMLRRAAGLSGVAPPEIRSQDDQLPGGCRVREYSPEAEEPAPLLVYFHGGRFISGDLASHDVLCRQLASASGARVLAVDYRLAPEHRFPAAVEDAAEAVEYALRRAASVGVAGDSAGANLAAGAAREFHRRLRSQLLIYPMIDALCGQHSHREFASGYGPGSTDMQRGWREYAGHANPRDPRLSPLYQPDLRGLPRTLVITAEFDPLRDEGELYAKRMREAGVPVLLKRWEGTIHGFWTMAGRLAVAREAIRFAGEWLRAAFNAP